MNGNRVKVLQNSIHHMVMACLSGDVDYLQEEIQELFGWFAFATATAQELEMLQSVSLEASLNNRVSCLQMLYEQGFPMDELCPIIAGCHGKKDVICFCETISLGDCEHAWNRYFDWMMVHSSSNERMEDDDECSDLEFAADWAKNYMAHQEEVICSTN